MIDDLLQPCFSAAKEWFWSRRVSSCCIHGLPLARWTSEQCRNAACFSKKCRPVGSNEIFPSKHLLTLEISLVLTHTFTLAVGLQDWHLSHSELWVRCNYILRTIREFLQDQKGFSLDWTLLDLLAHSRENRELNRLDETKQFIQPSVFLLPTNSVPF